MSPLPRVKIISGEFPRSTAIELNDAPLDHVQSYTIYQIAGEPFPTVILKFAAEVHIDVQVPTLYLERERNNAIQPEAGRSTDEGKSVAE